MTTGRMKLMVARYHSHCFGCRANIRPGQTIQVAFEGPWHHTYCELCNPMADHDRLASYEDADACADCDGAGQLADGTLCGCAAGDAYRAAWAVVAGEDEAGAVGWLDPAARPTPARR